MGVHRAPRGFAVVDFETTGLNPTKGDRAIEVGIVHVAPDGTLEDEAETLIRVRHDLGSSSLHHIHAADLMDAPEFSGIAARLRDLLDGYVFVAHNAVFDSRFLNAEYGRLGYATPVDRSTSICTLRLSNRYLGLRSLDDCCTELGIRNPDAHSALGDAHATALLLSGFLEGIPDWEGWKPALEHAADSQWPEIDYKAQEWLPRQSHAPSRRPASAFLNRLQSGNPAARSSNKNFQDDRRDAAAEYIGILDMCLLDGRMSANEKSALNDMATALHLSKDDRRRIHEDYFADIAEEAWLNGTLDDDEARELRDVGKLLSIDPEKIDYALNDRAHPISTARHARKTDIPDDSTHNDLLRSGETAVHDPENTVSNTVENAQRNALENTAENISENTSDIILVNSTKNLAESTAENTSRTRQGNKEKNRKKSRKHSQRSKAPGKDPAFGKTITRKRKRYNQPSSSNGSDTDADRALCLHYGDRIVLSGPFRRSTDEWIYLLENMGLVVWPTVTERIALVVAADTSGDSIAIRQANDCGVPIEDEEWLERAVARGLISD